VGQVVKRLAKMKIHLLFSDTNWLVRKNFIEPFESGVTLFACRTFSEQFGHSFVIVRALTLLLGTDRLFARFS
jgi:hypothetical protein